MFSKRVFEILYVKINVYGLDEYKTLPENTPLSAMFFCHGFGQTQENLEFYCQRLCQLNTTRRSSDRYLIIITLDHPNSGTRKTYDESPMPKPGSRTHQDIIFKIHLSAKSTAQTIAGIIECFDYYAFGTECNSFVTKWGVIGYSMGGITAEFLPTFGTCF
ncbi:hypothetical protein K501DRAFT_184094 [Backusella circina FSU 941]|nr:hypothetical protein K501DRAFT_184094 [Backusella circina FSU 941]